MFSVPTAPSDRVPPIIRQGPANHTLAPGSTAQLHCHIMGNPIPSIQWEKDGQRILGNDDRISLMENGTFQITNLQVFKIKLFSPHIIARNANTVYLFLKSQTNENGIEIRFIYTCVNKSAMTFNLV